MPEVEAQSEESRARQRSPNYPAVSLEEATERVAKLYAADRKAGAPLEIALKHMGFSGKHGKSMMVASALKKYGLVEDMGGRLVPTQRAIEIVVLPKDDSRRLQALRDAALSPEINRELFDKFQADGFPSDETLASELVAYRGFNPGVVDNFVRDFKSTIDFASLTDHVEIPLESEVESDIGLGPATTAEATTRTAETIPVRAASPQSRVSATPSKRFTWPLSNDITATVEFSGGQVSESQIDLLQKYLELAKMAVRINTTDQGSTEKA
jgi:hypothetical protein